MNDEIIAARVRELLHYDPETGIFTRKVRTSNRCSADGNPCKSQVSGNQPRLRVHLDGKYYWAHRIAWLYMHGVWPTNQIDHKNGNALDNRRENLRDVTCAINRQNLRSAHPNNKYSGLLGVSLHRKTGKWHARIGINRRIINLGLHFTPEAAHQAYLEAKRKIHEGCTI